jgi:hypothetical protein
MGKNPMYENAFKHNNSLGIARGATKKLRRVIAVAAVLAVLFGTVTAHALGYNVFQSIAQWTDEIFTFRNIQNDGEQRSISVDVPADGEYTSIIEALEALGVTESVVPKWYPDGFIQTEFSVVQMSDRTRIYAFYENDEQSFSISITAHAMSPDSYTGFYEKDSEPVLEYESGGTTHFIMSNNSRNAAVWISGNLECSIQGDIAKDDLLKMIDSIYGIEG